MLYHSFSFYYSDGIKNMGVIIISINKYLIINQLILNKLS